jgi:hypothetical protein
MWAEDRYAAAHASKDELEPMDTQENGTKKFHGWRLIGVIMIVIVVLAIISALVDWMAFG